MQPVFPQHPRANQDFVAVDKGRLHSNQSAIEWEINQEDVFFNLLVGREKRRRTSTSNTGTPSSEMIPAINGGRPFDSTSPIPLA